MQTIQSGYDPVQPSNKKIPYPRSKQGPEERADWTERERVRAGGADTPDAAAFVTRVQLPQSKYNPLTLNS